MLDCVMPSIEELINYNKTVANYLNLKYGNIWIKSVRTDIFGITRKFGD